jgi:hypothetical protein
MYNNAALRMREIFSSSLGDFHSTLFFTCKNCEGSRESNRISVRRRNILNWKITVFEKAVSKKITCQNKLVHFYMIGLYDKSLFVKIHSVVSDSHYWAAAGLKSRVYWCLTYWHILDDWLKNYYQQRYCIWTANIIEVLYSRASWPLIHLKSRGKKLHLLTFISVWEILSLK